VNFSRFKVTLLDHTGTPTTLGTGYKPHLRISLGGQCHSVTATVGWTTRWARTDR
jgi:hypothetical protein